VSEAASTDPLAAVAGWPANATAGIIGPQRHLQAVYGPSDRPLAWASVTKVLAALAIWVAVEEGTVGWDDPAGPPGATLAHLLSHASGLAPDSDTVLAPPGTRRIYSNRGIEQAAAHLAAQAGLPFDRYVSEAVIEPLGLTDTTLTGSPAASARGPLVDLLALGRELALPTLVSAATVAAATSVAFPGLAGVLPGFGRQDPNDWGLGVEIRDSKHPHWTGGRNSVQTYGHFGQSGSFLWVDPTQDLVAASLADRPFGPWAQRAWPALSDALVESYGRR
jgi:CubicO group peptidase (beta-lactamase class C family)